MQMSSSTSGKKYKYKYVIMDYDTKLYFVRKRTFPWHRWTDDIDKATSYVSPHTARIKSKQYRLRTYLTTVLEVEV